MDQLVSMVAQRANISQDQAQQAVNTVLGFLKDKLPAPIAGQIDSVIGGAQGGAGNLGNAAGNALGGLGGMFGGNNP